MPLRNKTIIITLITGLAIIIIIGIGYFSGFFFDTGITPCLPPPNYMVDGAATARVFTWMDMNFNGLVDVGEKPLANVEIIFPPSSPVNKVTDNSGSANTFDFRAGCVCKCWEGSFVKVKTPDGFRATTPTSVELTSEDPLIEIGFIKVIP
jgi:hypothetical protein